MSEQGYSGTPLSRKLGLKPNFKILLVNTPSAYWEFYDSIPEPLTIVEKPEDEAVDFIHLFCRTLEDLEQHIMPCKVALKKTGMLWISWPKGTSSSATNLKRDPIRDYVLEIGLVDVKVAAINEDWSGLKFVYRSKDR